MANTIRIKRRSSSGSNGAPSSLKNGELAYNESDNTLYYGYGDDGSGNATSIPAIAGGGNYVTLTTNQTISGSKDFTGTFSLGGTAVTASATELNQLDGVTLGNAVELNVGISDTNLLQADSTVADNDFLRINGTKVEGRSAAEVRADLDLQVGIEVQAQNELLQDIADIGGTATGANQFIVSTAVGTFQLESGATVRTSIGLGTTNSPTFTGLTLSGDLNVNGGDITSDSSTFNFLTDNASVESLNIGDSGGNLATTFPGLVDIDSGLNVGASDEFSVDASGNISTSGTLAASFAAATTDTDAFLVSDSGTVKTRTGAQVLSDIGAQPLNALLTDISGLTIVDGTFLVGNASGDIVAESGATARASLGVDPAGTDNSTDVTLAGPYDYITISGQVITRGQIDLTTDVTGALPAANVGSLPASKITSGTFANARISSGSVTQHQNDISSVGTLDDLQVTGDVTVSTGDVVITAGNLVGPSTFYIDPAPNDSPHNNSPDSPAPTGKVVIRGDLQVDGTTTTINSTEISINDKNMVLADDQTDLAGVDNAGLYLGDDGAGAGEVNFVYDNSNTRMELTGTSNIGLYVSGGLQDTVIDGGTF